MLQDHEDPAVFDRVPCSPESKGFTKSEENVNDS